MVNVDIFRVKRMQEEESTLIISRAKCKAQG